MNTVLATLALLPALVASPKAPPEPEDVKAGWLGLLVFLLLVAAVVFLGRSLRKHLGKVDFDESDKGGSRSDSTSDGPSGSSSDSSSGSSSDSSSGSSSDTASETGRRPTNGPTPSA